MLWKTWKGTSKSCTRFSWTWQFWCTNKARNLTTSKAKWTGLILLFEVARRSWQQPEYTRKTPGNGQLLPSSFCCSLSWWLSSACSLGRKITVVHPQHPKTPRVKPLSYEVQWVVSYRALTPYRCMLLPILFETTGSYYLLLPHFVSIFSLVSIISLIL